MKSQVDIMTLSLVEGMKLFSFDPQILSVKFALTLRPSNCTAFVMCTHGHLKNSLFYGTALCRHESVNQGFGKVTCSYNNRMYIMHV